MLRKKLDSVQLDISRFHTQAIEQNELPKILRGALVTRLPLRHDCRTNFFFEQIMRHLLNRPAELDLLTVPRFSPEHQNRPA